MDSLKALDPERPIREADIDVVVMAPCPVPRTWLDVRKLGDAHAADYERRIDNLIRGLVDLLPKPDGIWPLDDRAKWLRTAAGIFDLVYKAGDGEHRELSIAFVKQQAANPPKS